MRKGTRSRRSTRDTLISSRYIRAWETGQTPSTGITFQSCQSAVAPSITTCTSLNASLAIIRRILTTMIGACASSIQLRPFHRSLANSWSIQSSMSHCTSLLILHIRTTEVTLWLSRLLALSSKGLTRLLDGALVTTTHTPPSASSIKGWRFSPSRSMLKTLSTSCHSISTTSPCRLLSASALEILRLTHTESSTSFSPHTIRVFSRTTLTRFRHRPAKKSMLALLLAVTPIASFPVRSSGTILRAPPTPIPSPIGDSISANSRTTLTT